MDEGEKVRLRKAIVNITTTKEEFSWFSFNARIQLLLGQFQLFQSLAAISLALTAIALTTKTFEPTLWWLLTVLFSAALLLYSTTYVRETIDFQAGELDKAEESLERLRDEVVSKVKESFEKNTPLPFQEYLDNTSTHPNNPTQEYAGEIAVFLFSSTAFFGLWAVLDSLFTLRWIPIPLTLVTLLIFAALTSFFNWNRKITDRISKSVSHTLVRNGGNHY